MIKELEEKIETVIADRNFADAKAVLEAIEDAGYVLAPKTLMHEIATYDQGDPDWSDVSDWQHDAREILGLVWDEALDEYVYTGD